MNLRPKKLENLFPVYLWFEPQNYLKIVDRGKSYYTGEFGLIPMNGLGFRAQNWGFLYEYYDRERTAEWILFKFSSFIPWEG